ncbi:MAG: type II secretion system F family protein [Deltaproteobacteria bacterium]|nr:type II secretion system F family protein [Deltaproteobacteria bacterium]
MGTTDIMLIASCALFGLATFLLAYKLFPQSFMDNWRARAREERRGPSSHEVVARHAVVHRPPGALAAFGNALASTFGVHCRGMVRDRWGEKMKRRFLALGRPELLPEDFIARQFLYTFFFGLVGVLLFNMMKRPLWYSPPFFLFGYFFPYIVLRDQIKRRQQQLIRALPYHVDLLTLSVEAGLDFGSALDTVVQKGQAGPLIEELGTMLNEMKLGHTREEALRNLSKRVQVMQVGAFVSNIIQADKMGTSMGRVLRVQSGQMRVERAQRAEELANQAPVKMLLPLVLCFFPNIFLILFGPILYRMFFVGI